MAFTKIQPQQVQLATFLSPSGDLTFTDNVTGVSANLSRSLAGDFNFTDSLKVSSNEVVLTDNTNNSSDLSITIGGVTNLVSGNHNVLVNGTLNTFSGNYNTLLNGKSVNFGVSGQKNTIVSSDGGTFSNSITGSVILADHESTPTVNTNHSLTISFNSGTTFENGDITHNGDEAFFNSHLHVDSAHSGMFSGGLYVSGNSYFYSDSVFNSAVDINADLTLSDNSIAASRTWVGNKINHDLPVGLTGDMVSSLGYSNGTSFLANHSSSENEIITGRLITGHQNATFVFCIKGFTGTLDFDRFRTNDYVKGS